MTVLPSVSASAAPGQAAQTDLTALRFSGWTVLTVSLLGLLLGLLASWAFALPLALGAAMVLGAVRPAASPLLAVYRRLSSSLGLTPDVVAEDPRAHHFAQGVGGSCLLLAGVSGVLGLTPLAVLLSLLVAALAALNLSQRICVGCLLYFQFRRLRFALLHR